MAAIIVGDEVTIVGNIISNGKVQVEGDVQGYVFCTNIRVCDGGRVSGGIVAEKVTVHGEVTGPINALSVTLEPGAHAQGDICHRDLKLDHESYFEGRSQRSENPLVQALTDLEKLKQAPPPPPAAKPRLPELRPVHPRRSGRHVSSARSAGRGTSSLIQPRRQA